VHRFPVVDARAPGDDSRAQLVATLEAAARTVVAYHARPQRAGWAHRLARRLRGSRPDADRDVTDPAAFPPYSPQARQRP
jgi:hypothetical protein